MITNIYNYCAAAVSSSSSLGDEYDSVVWKADTS